jgi:uncharacterized membrane protein
MALSDLFSNLHIFFRWLHVFFGIIWIGHLYFFNFVNIPFQGSIDDATKKVANPQLIPRALWWFRWGAMGTFLVGWVLFTLNYMYTPGIGFGPTNLFSDAYGMTGRAVWILIGMLLGSIMWFNVWFIIWPSQQRILGLCGKEKAQGDELAAIRKKATLASKINTYLSAPMLFSMLAAPHYGAINPLTFVLFGAVTALFVWSSYRHSAKVGKPS